MLLFMGSVWLERTFQTQLSSSAAMEPQVDLKEPFYFYPSCPGSGRVLRWLRGGGCFPKVSSIGPHPWWVFITLPAPSECSAVPCWDINTGMQCGPFL